VDGQVAAGDVGEDAVDGPVHEQHDLVAVTAGRAAVEAVESARSLHAVRHRTGVTRCGRCGVAAGGVGLGGVVGVDARSVVVGVMSMGVQVSWAGERVAPSS